MIEDLKDLASEWKDLGTYIGINSAEIKVIETERSGRPDLVSDCFGKVIDAWLDGENVNKEKLARAVENVGYGTLATEIRQGTDNLLGIWW